MALLICLSFSVAAKAAQVTLNLKAVPLATAFNEIKKQTGYGFWYEKKDLADLPKITVSVKNADIVEVIDVCLKGLPLTYQVFDKTVVVKRKPAAPVKTSNGQLDFKVRGKVTDENAKPMPGVTIRLLATNQMTITDNDGNFEIAVANEQAVLQLSYLGYATIERQVGKERSFSFVLKETENSLNSVQVVSTGYQTLPKERATGSFTVVDNKLLNRSVSPDLVSRLKGVTNGMLHDKTTGGFNIRGRSTIFSQTYPLIVVDNFPFEGDINTINPNDIESVTVLKDAAAAAIWGVRAGNGVLVITTKRGRANQPSQVELNANLTIGARPDLYYQPQLSSSEFIDLEIFRFNNNDYAAPLFFDFETISPVVVELLKAQQDPSYLAQANANIDKLRTLDVRNQLNQYFYRNSSRQQYSANINGGSEKQTYFFSAGYDKNLPNEVNLSDSRITLRANNSYSLLKDRLKLSADISFNQSKSLNTNAYGYTPYLPYEQLADADGNALATLRAGGLRSAFTDTVGGGRLLDWKYRPLEELRDQSTTSGSNLTGYRLLLGANYKILSSLQLDINYQYFSSSQKGELSFDRRSFYTRDLINSISQLNTTTGQVTRPIPFGDVFTPSFMAYQGNYGRAQLNFNETYGSRHNINAIAGYEIRADETQNNSYRLYGYDPKTGASALVDAVRQYPFYYGFNTLTIGNRTNQGASLNRYLSYYANASYIYNGKYVLSGSYRKDESNLFGVKANQKGVPLWSSGLAWNLHKERWMDIRWLSFLRLKATFGYNGNVNQSVSAYLTAKAEGINPHYGANYYSIVNPPNDDLRWERVKNINLGADFALFGNRLSGSAEYYVKNGIDLIGTSPVAPQAGVSVYTGNSANTLTKGIDVQLSSINTKGLFNWNTIAIFNYASNKVTAYKVNPGTNGNLMASGISPVVDYPVQAIFGYRWHGLDATGNPQGELDGALSKDYTAMRNSTDLNVLDYHGSAVPTVFGSLRNNFSFRNWELSFNITYKFNYYFRRGSFTDIGSYQQADYAQRWQKPGDELTTNVPAIIYPMQSVRNSFYQNASILVERGDHVRLQDIQLNYTFGRESGKKLPFSQLNIYGYLSNLGIIWKANKKGIDPDQGIFGYPTPRTFAFGLRTNF